MNADQFSAASAEALRESAARLAQLIQRYAEATASMSGETAELEEVFALNAQISALAAELNDRAFDHTGTLPLPLDLQHGEPEHDHDVEDEETVEATGFLSAVSRWDLAITDEDALLEAGRAAYRQATGATEAEASVEVSDASDAVRAILESRGEPWFEIPGVAAMGGLRLLIEPDDVPGELFDGDPEHAAQAVLPPDGQLLVTEAWG